MADRPSAAERRRRRLQQAMDQPQGKYGPDGQRLPAAPKQGKTPNRG